MELTALNCTRCGANISEDKLTESLVTCNYCGCVLVLSTNQDSHIRKLIPLPENIQVEQNNSGFSLKYQWKNSMGIVTLIAGSFMFFFALIWISVASGAGFMFSMFGLPFIVISLIIAYFGIANIINETTIKIENGSISIKFSPLYWPGQKNLLTKDILQLYVNRKEYNNKGNITYTYNIIGLLKENKSTTLLKMIQQPEVAKCIEQQIEKYLNIKDIPINGEYHV